jgi:hypothetical protein
MLPLLRLLHPQPRHPSMPRMEPILSIDLQMVAIAEVVDPLQEAGVEDGEEAEERLYPQVSLGNPTCEFDSVSQ